MLDDRLRPVAVGRAGSAVRLDIVNAHVTGQVAAHDEEAVVPADGRDAWAWDHLYARHMTPDLRPTRARRSGPPGRQPSCGRSVGLLLEGAWKQTVSNGQSSRRANVYRALRRSWSARRTHCSTQPPASGGSLIHDPSLARRRAHDGADFIAIAIELLRACEKMGTGTGQYPAVGVVVRSVPEPVPIFSQALRGHDHHVQRRHAVGRHQIDLVRLLST